MAAPFELTTSQNVEVWIPGEFCRTLTFDEKESLLSALLSGGGDETTDYDGINVTYCNATRGQALAQCRAVLSGLYPEQWPA